MNLAVDTPEQVVALAIELEQHCGLLYEEWARRFKPYDREISELLEGLAQEELEHAREFRALQEAPASGTPLPCDALPPEFDACLARLESIRDHFFVTGPVMATTILEAALKVENFTREFYRELEASTPEPAIAAVCRRLGSLEEAHVQDITARLAAERQKLAEA
ncbi:MAG TPA: hypothetical protein ENK48_01155 [Gammaproteobacteria bacterium]|nr:hypothetical protein [Gammaproteobacteria bacterium]